MKKVIYLSVISVIAFFAFVAMIIFLAIEGESRMGYGIFLCGVGIFAIFVCPLLRLIFRLRIPSYIDIYIILLVLFAFIAGEIFRLYDMTEFFDKGLHFANGLAITAIAFSITPLIGVKNASPLFVAIFAFSFSMMWGVVWELLEFDIDLAFDTNMQRWQDDPSTQTSQGSGVLDTMFDQFAHLVGALIVAIIGGIIYKKYPEGKRFLCERLPKNK